MERFLASKGWQWRLLCTIVQGVLGVVVTNLDLIELNRFLGHGSPLLPCIHVDVHGLNDVGCG